ncbi:MAG: hypothetical protein M0006_09040 [Magnetospirillum sp.]|nr:hypothetical protein [Magnetospirillum sp.]
MSRPPQRPSPGLNEFLADEVRARPYADLLLERTLAAGRGEAVPGASGDAFYVTFGPEEIVIEHHYLEDWPLVRVPRETFLAALARHRQTLP